MVGLATAVGFLAGDANSLFVALGKAKRNMVLAVASLVLPVGLLLLAAVHAGGRGALLGEPVHRAAADHGLAGAARTRRSPWWLLEKVLPGVLATGCMAAAVLALQTAVPMPPGMELLASMGCGAAVYVAAAAALLRWQLPPALVAPPRGARRGRRVNDRMAAASQAP